MAVPTNPSQIQSYMDRMKAQAQHQANPAQPALGGGSYLNTSTGDDLAKQGKWSDFIRQLGFANLSNITNFNSPLYQQYSQYLQKNTPQVGVNSLLAPLLAGGASYGGSQMIASQRANAMQGRRNDAIQQGVQGFAMNMQNQVMPQLGQIGGSFFQTQEQTMQQDAMNQANSPWGQIGGVLGGVAGTLLAPGIGTAIGSQIGGGVGQAAGGAGSPNANQYWGNARKPSPYGYGG